jgi:hypothetical protein
MKDWQTSSAEHRTGYHQRRPTSVRREPSVGAAASLRSGQARNCRLPNPSTLSNCQAMRTYGFTLFLKEPRLRDEQIASLTAPVLRRHSGRSATAPQTFAGHSVTSGRTTQCPQIFGHNSPETLATPASTGVASGPTQLFAGALLEETAGVALGRAFEAGEELTMTSHMFAPPPIFQSPSDEAVRP